MTSSIAAKKAPAFPDGMIRTGRMGLVQYGRVLAAITSAPSTHAAVSAVVDRQPQRIREILWRMKQMGEAHVVRWEQSVHLRGPLCAVFAAGPGFSVPYPRELKRAAPGSTLAKSNPRPELISFCSAIRALRDGGSRAEIGAATGIAPMRLSLLLRSLHADGLTHCSGWSREGESGSPAQVFTLGAGRDVPRPKPEPFKSKQDRYRAKRRALVAMQRITHATAGTGRIVVNGMQSYGMLGGRTE